VCKMDVTDEDPNSHGRLRWVSGHNRTGSASQRVRDASSSRSPFPGQQQAKARGVGGIK